MNGTLKDNEYHPAANSAMKYIKSLGNVELMKWQESFCSCAIEGNYLAGICAETMRRILEGEPVSDRYLLGLAWTIREGEKE